MKMRTRNNPPVWSVEALALVMRWVASVDVDGVIAEAERGRSYVGVAEAWKAIRRAVR